MYMPPPQGRLCDPVGAHASHTGLRRSAQVNELIFDEWIWSAIGYQTMWFQQRSQEVYRLCLNPEYKLYVRVSCSSVWLQSGVCVHLFYDICRGAYNICKNNLFLCQWVNQNLRTRSIEVRASLHTDTYGYRIEVPVWRQEEKAFETELRLLWEH